MATVYLGCDGVLGRTVAIKVLKRDLDGDIAERFQREGRTAARLSHPNLVQVFDAGEAELDGRKAPYIVMEHVRGGDLKSLIDTEGRLDSERVASLGAGVSAGLAHAHDRGVVHRDIKPHNVLLDESGSPKLTDFGIARALDTTAMTVSGVYLGTALYSAPEQLKGQEITPKSDVYSLGAALYQAATGDPPFSGTTLEVANQHTMREPDPPGSLRSSGDPAPELDALILSCLAKDPADRPIASEARDRLSSISGGYRDPEPVAASGPAGYDRPGEPVESKKRRKPVLRTFAGAAALVLLLVGGAAFAMMGDLGVRIPAPGSQIPKVGQSPASSPEEPGSAGGTVQREAQSPPAAPRQVSESAARKDDFVEGSNAAGAEAAARTVRDVYRLASAEDYDASYSLLSSGFRQREAGSLESWAGTFGTLESLSFIQGPTATVSGETAQVTGTTRAVHSDRTETNRGTWNLVRENGEWRLDSLSIRKL